MDKYQFDRENHIHKLNDEYLTGTTTALSILQPPLTWWASGLAVAHLGWFNDSKSSKNYIPQEIGFPKLEKRFEEIRKMTTEEYQKELNLAYKAHSVRLKDAGQKGTDTHELVERFIKSQINGTKFEIGDEPELQKRQVGEFIEWASQNIKKFIWSEICTYSKIHKVGGISDFGYIDMEDRLIIGDIKTGKDIYEEQFIQAGAYDMQLSESGGYNDQGEQLLAVQSSIQGYTIVLLPKEGTIKVGHSYNRKAQQEAFLAALLLFRHLKK